MLQCTFCSAAFRKLQRNFCFSLVACCRGGVLEGWGLGLADFCECTLPEGKNDWKISRSPSEIELFKRDRKFEANRPPNPYFCGEFWRSRWNFQARLKPSSEFENSSEFFFSIFGAIGSLRCSLPGEHANVPSFRFSFRGNIRMYPRSGFRSEGTSAKTTLLETTLYLSTPK